MNNVVLIGRLTRDPDVRYTSTQLAIARFSLAIDRGKDREGNDRGADFPSVVVFGKQAENCERYLAKGKLVAIQGRIQTGSYEKDGRKIYTTEVVAERVKFLEWGDRPHEEHVATPSQDGIPEGFQAIEDEDIPF